MLVASPVQTNRCASALLCPLSSDAPRPAPCVPAGTVLTSRRAGGAIAGSSSSSLLGASITQPLPAATAQALPSFATLGSAPQHLSSNNAPSLPLATARAHVPARSSSMSGSALLSAASMLAPVSSSIQPLAPHPAHTSEANAAFLEAQSMTASTLSSFCAASDVSSFSALQAPCAPANNGGMSLSDLDHPTSSSAPVVMHDENMHMDALDEAVAKHAQQQQHAAAARLSVCMEPAAAAAAIAPAPLPVTVTVAADPLDEDMDCSAPEAGIASDSCDSAAASAAVAPVCSPFEEAPTAPVTPIAPSFGALPADLPRECTHLWTEPELAAEILDHWFSVDGAGLPPADYLRLQPDLNAKMREILADWMHEVAQRFRLSSEVLFLAMNLLDRFLSRKAVSRKKLQLVGCVALLLAAKYEEIYLPEVADFITISDNAYSREHVLHMEGVMLNTLEFRLTIVSSNRFLARFANTPATPWLWAATRAQQAIQLDPHAALADDSLRRTLQTPHLAQFLLESTLQSVRFLAYRPSTLAAAVVYLVANHWSVTMQQAPFEWDACMQSETRHTVDMLRSCVGDVYAHWWSMRESAIAASQAPASASAAGSSRCLAVWRKFGKERYGMVNQIVIARPAIIE